MFVDDYFSFFLIKQQRNANPIIHIPCYKTAQKCAYLQFFAQL